MSIGIAVVFCTDEYAAADVVVRNPLRRICCLATE